MWNTIDLTNQKFGHLTVINRAVNSKSTRHARWNCICDCGENSIVDGTKLRNGETQSCGCLRKKSGKANPSWKHGMRIRGSYMPEYEAWKRIKTRCKNPKNKDWKYYGARGIKVCRRWEGRNGFIKFLADMGYKPTPIHSIDRKNNDGNYEPGNCHWATPKEQSLNRRRKWGWAHIT